MKKDTIAFVVPTGIGACIGGFAGDASVWARQFAREFNVVVNPNVVNAACFSGITDNMLYTEGWALSRFFEGSINLVPRQDYEQNKIGIIFDSAIPKDVMNVHINTINAVKTVYGLDIAEIEITDEPCGVEFFLTESGISSGRLNNPETLLNAGKKLLAQGAEAIAVVAFFEELENEDGNKNERDRYAQGEAVDIVGGIEAVISHYLSSELLVPVAHAPAFADYSISSEIVDPRAAAEYITPTFLPCILLGLNRAPLLTQNRIGLNIKDVKALVVPHDCLGSSIVFDAIENNVTVYAVKENSTVLNIDKSALNIHNGIIKVKGYKECLETIKKQHPHL